MVFLAVIRAAAQSPRVPVRAGAWLTPLRLHTRRGGDPLAAFEAWRRANHVTLPAPPNVVAAHRAWLRRHLAGNRRLRQIRPRRELQARTSLPGVANNGNVAPAGGVADYQGEISVAINPSDPQQMVAGSNSFLPGPSGIPVQALFGSQDGGQTWTYQSAPLPAALASQILFGSDPSVAWNAQGEAYASYMAIGMDSNIGVFTTAIVTAESSDGGQTWQPLGVVVNHLSDIQYFDDKDMLAVDTSSAGAYSHAGRLYVIWDENNTELLAWSDDGATWTTVTLEDAAHAGEDIGGDVAVGADGAVYAIWTRYAGNPGAAGGGDELAFSKSVDGGNTWTAPVVIAAGALTLTDNSVLIPAQDQRGIDTFGSIAVDDSSSPYAGTIYVVYSDLPAAAGTPPQAVNIYLVRSQDGGQSWTAPVAVNDDVGDGASHFFPWCAVDPATGVLSVSWYDTRDDPLNYRAQEFYAQSTDGGASFSPNIAVSQPDSALANGTVSYSDENSVENLWYNPNQYGDYEGISAAGGRVLLGWTDSRDFFPGTQTDPLAEDMVTDTLGVSAPLTYTISGQVSDAQGNGVAGVTLTAGSASAVTDGAGRYQLAGLAAGSYAVAANATGISFAPASAAVTLSDAPATGVNFSATSAPPLYAISGRVTLDGTGVAGATLQAGPAAALTGGDGSYAIQGLPAGTYTVTASDPAYALSPASQTVTVSGGDATGVDFTVPTYSISGVVTAHWLYGPSSAAPPTWPVAGATIRAGPATGKTDANGEYTLAGLPAGNYGVSGSLGGYQFLSDWAVGTSVTPVTLSGANAPNIDFTAESGDLYEIQGQVTWNGTGLSGVTVSTNDAAGVTDAGGNYLLFEPYPGNYTLTARAPGFGFAPASESVSVAASTNGGAVTLAPAFAATATAPVFAVSGQVTVSGSTPLAQATVAAGLASAVTDAQGNYSIAGLGDGAYTLDAAAAGDIFNPEQASVNVAGSDPGGVNFTASPALLSISGRVATAAGQPVAAVTLQAYQNGGLIQTFQAGTGADGTYTLTGLPPFAREAYVIVPSAGGYLFSPPQQLAPLTDSDLTGVDFTALPAATVSGRIATSLGQGVAGMQVTSDELTETPAVQTDGNGNYTLTLSQGWHVITPNWPPGENMNLPYVFSPQTLRIDVPPAGLTGINFTASQTYGVSGQILTVGGQGVAGAPVDLQADPPNAPDGALYATTSTDAHGDFYFQNVPNSDYLVVPHLAGMGIMPADQYVQVNEDRAGLTFQTQPGAVVSGTVTQNGQGLSGVLLQFDAATEISYGAIFTAADGTYSLSLPNGGYTVRPWDPPYIISPATPSLTVNGAAIGGFDFTAVMPVLTLTASQTQFAVNTAVDSVQDTLTLGSNVSNPVQFTCAEAGCTITPNPLDGSGTAQLTLTGLAQSVQAKISVPVTAAIGAVQQSVLLVIQRQSVQLTAAATTVTAQLGQTADFDVTVTPVNGYTGPVALSCWAANTQPCTVTPASVDLAGAPVTVTAALTATTSSGAGPGPLEPPAGGGRRTVVLLAVLALAAALLGGIGLPLRWGLARAVRARWRIAALAAALAWSLAGCGGGPNPVVNKPPPPPPPPPVTTQAVSVGFAAKTGPLSQQLGLTLNVQSGG